MAIGQRVEANGEGRSGVVAFIGMTKFASGVWIGVILDASDGKNDGSVNGHSYFSCEPKHGVFVRASQVKLLEAEIEAESAVAETAEEEKEDVKAKYANKVKQKKLALAERRKEISKKEEEAQQRADKKVPRDSANETAEEPAAAEPTTVKSRRSSVEKERPVDASSVPTLDLAKIAALEKSLSEIKASQENAIAKMKEAIKERDAARRSATTFEQQAESSKAKLKEIEDAQGSFEDEKQELSDMVESLTMDVEMERDEKELLEEKTAELELRVAELEGDIDLYVEAKDQGAEGDGGNEMKLLADQNDKLKEALQRLHEATLAQQNRIKELERDNKTIEVLQSEVIDLTKRCKSVPKLTEEVESLKEALEEASEFGEFAEELTEKNLKLSEQVAEMTEQIDFYQEMKEAAEMMEEVQQEEIRELQLELSNREALETNSLVAIQQMKSKVEEAEQANEQLHTALKLSQDNLNQLSSDGNNGNVSQVISQASEQEVLARKFELQKQAEEAAANKLELALALVNAQVLQARQDCLAAMVNGEEDIRSIDAVTQLNAIMLKGQVVETHLREQVVQSVVDLDEMQRIIAAHKVIVDSVGIAETMLDVMRLNEEVFLKLGQRSRDLKSAMSSMDALITSIKHGQAIEVDSAQDLLQKLTSLQSSEALTEYECSRSIVTSAICKLSSESRLLSAAGAKVSELGSSEVVSNASRVIVAHAQFVSQASDRILQSVKSSTQALKLDNVQKNGLIGTSDTVTNQVARVITALIEACGNESKLEEFLNEIGMDMDTAQVSQDSKPDCIDAQLDAAVGKLRVFGSQMSDCASSTAAEEKPPTWVRRGAAHCEALTFSTQFTDKYAAAEEELKGVKTAVKRGEKDLEDANAKVQVLSRRLEDKTAEITTYKGKVEDLSKQEETYQKAMDVLQDSLQEQVNKKNAAQEKLNNLEAEMVTRALTAPHPGAGITSEAGSMSFGSGDTNALQLTIQSLWKMNRSLRAKLMSKHVSEFPAPAKPKVVSTKQTQLSDSVNTLQRDVTSLMAMPKVVSLVKSTKDSNVQPEQRWRQANAEIYKAQYRCNELKGQLQREYLKSNAGAAAQTNFSLFPSRHVASEVFQPGAFTPVGRVVLSDRDANSGIAQKVHLNYDQFQALHSAILAR